MCSRLPKALIFRLPSHTKGPPDPSGIPPAINHMAGWGKPQTKWRFRSLGKSLNQMVDLVDFPARYV